MFQGNNMILQTAVQYFKQTFRPYPDESGEGTPAIPNIISSKIEHPAINEYLEHLQSTGQAGNHWNRHFKIQRQK